MPDESVNRHNGLQIPIATLPPDQEVGEKTYHNRVPGAVFYDAVGAAHQWNHRGDLTTKSKNLQTELDKIADRPGSPVYTTEKPKVFESDIAPTTEIQNRAAEVVKQLKEAQAKQVGAA